MDFYRSLPMDTLYVYILSNEDAKNVIHPVSSVDVVLNERVLSLAVDDWLNDQLFRHCHPIVQITIQNMVQRMTGIHEYGPSVVLHDRWERDVLVMTWVPIKDKAFRLWLEGDMDSVSCTSVMPDRKLKDYIEWDAFFHLLLRQIDVFHEGVVDALFKYPIQTEEPEVFQRITHFTERMTLYPYEHAVQKHRFHMMMEMLAKRPPSESLQFLTLLHHSFHYDMTITSLRHTVLTMMREEDPDDLFDLLEEMTKQYPYDVLLKHAQAETMKNIETLYKPNGTNFDVIQTHFEQAVNML